jgi:L-alanine-DL-glutamate epimerase-like enolase superfamily enzyme
METTKIKAVTIEPIDVQLDEPFTISLGIQYSIKNVLITILLENGIEGYGEAAPFETINGENQASVMAVLNSCKDFLIGKDVSDYTKIARQLKNTFWPQVAARCALEMALLDAFTKSLNLPLYKFLGGMEDWIETDFTLDMMSPDFARKSASILAKKGYNILKIKVGKNIKEDIQRILAVIEGAPDAQFTLDANQGFTPSNAVHFLEELERRDIRPVLFEQPVLKTDLEGMKFVKDHTCVPIAADETVFSSADAVNVVRKGCADVINIKIMKSGIVEALDIAAIARGANIGLMMGSMLETWLALSCSVHIAAGLGGFSHVDLDPHIDPEKNPFTEGPDFKEPYYQLSDKVPGIGIRRRK